MTTPPVLDLRPNGAFQTHLLEQYVVGGEMPRTFTGGGRGWDVRVQRSSRRGLHEGIRIRLRAPDGRVLNVVGARRGNRDIRDQCADILSPAVRRCVNRSKLTDADRVAIDAELDRIVTEGLRCLWEGVSGTPALVRVGSAAMQADPVQVLSFDPFAPLQSSRIADGDVSVRQIVTLIRYGFTRESAVEWFGKYLKVPDEGTVKAMAAFRDAGWTWEQVKVAEGFEQGIALDRVKRDGTGYQRPKPSDLWRLVALTWEEASLALSAGLPARAAVQLKRSGNFDPAALVTMAALRNDHPVTL